jgi:hypothetical protein
MTNKMQPCRIIYYSFAALHVSNDIFAHHQEHLNCITASGITHICRCWLVSWECWNGVPTLSVFVKIECASASSPYLSYTASPTERLLSFPLWRYLSWNNPADADFLYDGAAMLGVMIKETHALFSFVFLSAFHVFLYSVFLYLF